MTNVFRAAEEIPPVAEERTAVAWKRIARGSMR